MQHDTQCRLALLVALVVLGCDDPAPTLPTAASSGPGGTGAATGPVAGASSGVGGNAGEPAGCAPVPAEDGFVDVLPSDPGIRYVGRLDFTNPDSPRMAFPAITIETRFEGDAIDMRLNESAPGGPAGAAYYDVSIDSGPPSKLMACRQQTLYPLARSLASGTHTIRISRRTEAQVGKTFFLGFRVRPGTAVSLPAAPLRLLEFVGDSITCGYGDEVSTNDPNSYKFTSTNENALLAYGAVTAGTLSADYVAVAASGRGMVRNYTGGSGLTGPEFYELADPDASDKTWDHARYTPDVIVVNLGTNDFSPGLSADELTTMRSDYRQKYADLLVRLRELHPLATLIAAVGPMMTDSYPSGYQAWTSMRSDVTQTVDARVAAGDSNVFYLEFSPQSGPYGEDWHPTIATHQQMANVLVPFIQDQKGWQ
jgi:lysophospholipase L1-like esterase